MTEGTGGDGFDVQGAPHVEARIDASLAVMPPEATVSYAWMNESTMQDYLANPTTQWDHLLRSMQAIRSTAQAALRRSRPGEQRRALILGAGNCLDIPLEEIVDTFDHTTLVDVHVTSTEKALADLPSRLLGKVSLVGADVSGIMAGFITDMQRLGEEQATYDGFTAAAAAKVDSFDPKNKQPDVGRDYTFVCSQLLLTQLTPVPYGVLNGAVVNRKYDRRLSMQSGTPLGGALEGLNTHLQHEHISYLAHVVGQTGTVHFADTYGKVVASDRGLVLSPMVDDDLLQAKIDEHFTTLAPSEQWFWPTFDGGQFLVASYSLAPRDVGSEPVRE